MAGPTRSRFTVMALSIITCEGSARPFVAVGRTLGRRSGASTSVADRSRTVTVAVSPKRSDWMTTAGRGLPKSPGMATVTR